MASTDFSLSAVALLVLSAFIAALSIFSASIAVLSVFSASIAVLSVFAASVTSSLVSVILCVSFEALLALQLAYNATRGCPFANLLSFVFCNTFSLLCFNNLLLSVFIAYIFVVLPFLDFTTLALFFVHWYLFCKSS